MNKNIKKSLLYMGFYFFAQLMCCFLLWLWFDIPFINENRMGLSSIPGLIIAYQWSIMYKSQENEQKN